MLRTLRRRLLWMLPTLWLITMLTFSLTQVAPDPMLQADCGGIASGQTFAEVQACLSKKRHELGLDKPLFYLSVATLAEPDSLGQLDPVELRDSLRRLLFYTGTWDELWAYRQAVEALYEETFARRTEVSDSILTRVELLERFGDRAAIDRVLTELDQLAPAAPISWQRYLAQVEQHYQELHHRPQRWRNFVPQVHWHGWDNQYHCWLTGFLQGDWGRSYVDQEPVYQKLRNRLPWSFSFALLGSLIVFVVAIPVGVAAAMYPGSGWDRGSSLLGLTLEVIPAFWVGLLLVSVFADPDVVGTWAVKMGFAPQFHTWQEGLAHMPLPMIAYVYGSFAYLSRLMRSSLQAQLHAPYLRTARAKGLSEAQVVWRHAFRNSLLPVVTYLTAILPTLLIGAVIVEEVFGIQAMGQATLAAVSANDIPVVMVIFSLIAGVTLLSYFIADMLYLWLDPRLRSHS